MIKEEITWLLVWWTGSVQQKRCKHRHLEDHLHNLLWRLLKLNPIADGRRIKKKSRISTRLTQTELNWHFQGFYCAVCFSLPLSHTEKDGTTIFFICATQYLYVCVYVCVSFVHVWCLLKCVSSDSTPYCPPRGGRDMAILCLRCRKAMKKRRKKKRCRKYWNSLECSLQAKRCRLARTPCWNLQDTISFWREGFVVYSHNFLAVVVAGKIYSMHHNWAVWVPKKIKARFTSMRIHWQ